MGLNDILTMSHELALIGALLILLIVEIFSTDESRKNIVPISIFLIIAAGAAGFYFSRTGVIFGSMYQNDALRMAMKLILDLATLIVFLQSSEWIKNPENKPRVTEFYLLIFSTLIGMGFMISSGDFLMLYLGLELATIPIAALAAFDRYKKESAEAGIKLILSSALSSGLLLYGLSMIYGTTGSIYFEEVKNMITPNTLPMLGMIFFITGMAFKISLVPFHFWTADVYEGAPIAVTSYLSVVSKGAAIFIFTFVLYTVFGAQSAIWSQILVLLSVITMTIGNLFALRQQNMKRFLAYSSIAQAGFILLGILGQGSLGMGSVIYFLLIYVFSNLGAFGVVAIISAQTGKETLADYRGLYATNPKLSLALMIALFSLAGIPPIAGFFGKLFLFNAAASKGFYWLLFIAVVNATISLYYYLLPVKAMFIDKTDNPIPFFKTKPMMALSLIICMVGLVVTGFASIIFEYFISVSAGL